MLTKCPECKLQVSTKALLCPHCGNPFSKNLTRKNSPKRMRLPNGFGRITEIKSKPLRKPFRAMVTIGKDEFGRPIGKPLRPESYFKTYNEAYTALVEYHKNPFDLSNDITLEELYSRWSAEHYPSVKRNTRQSLISAWSHCIKIHKMLVRDIRVRHVKEVIECESITIDGKTHVIPITQQHNIKTLLHLLFDYAVEYELADRNYARDYIPKKSAHVIKGHINFTDEEMDLLWKNINVLQGVDLLIIQCYSGWRPQELCLLKLENVDLENMTMTGGMKTEAGTNRTVPIHSKIKELVIDQCMHSRLTGCDTAFTLKNGIPMKYPQFLKAFKHIVDTLELNPEHKPHDGRVQFVTQAKRYGVDEYAIKYLVGHSIQDLTEKVYTKRSTNWLKEEVEKMK